MAADGMVGEQPDPEDEAIISRAQALRITRHHSNLADVMLLPQNPDSLAGRVKFDHREDTWHVWNGHRFAPDAKEAVYEMFDRWARILVAARVGYAEADTREAKALVSLLDANTREQVLKYIKHRPGVAMEGHEWDQIDYLLGVDNGVVDLRTGALRDGRPEDLISKSTGAPYDPKAYSLRFERFLREVYVTDEMVAYMQRAIGSLLVGGHIKAFLLLLGDTDTGKTTLVTALSDLLGDYAVPLGIKSFAKAKWQGPSNAHTRDLMALPGSRFAYAVESDDQTTLDVARLKAMTGGEPQLLAGAYSRHERKHRVTWKVWLGSNTPPKVADESDATWQRMQSIPHTVRFWKADDPAKPYGTPEQDPGLADTLRAELPGILAMAVAWAREFIAADRQLLPLPQEARDLRDELHDDDDIAAWVEMEMVKDPSGSVGAAEAYAAYQRWCARNNMDPVGSVTFATQLRKRASDKKKSGGSAARYLGVRFATMAEVSG
jgi:putative DNA primase/helicase